MIVEKPIPRGRDSSQIPRGDGWISLLSFGHFCACSKFCLFITRVPRSSQLLRFLIKRSLHSPSVSSLICSLVICFVCNDAFVFLLQVLVFIFTSHIFKCAFLPSFLLLIAGLYWLAWVPPEAQIQNVTLAWINYTKYIQSWVTAHVFICEPSVDM